MRVTAPADKRFRRAHVKPTRRRKKWGVRLRVAVQCLGAFAVFGGGGYVIAQQVVHADALHVSSVVVRGNERLATADVMRLLDGLQGQHVLDVDLDMWRGRVQESAWVEHAALRRVLPSTVEVFIEERRPIAVGRIGSDLYLVDPLGRVIDEYGPAYAQFDLPIVDGLGSTPAIGEPLVDEGRAQLAHDVIAALRRHGALYRRVSQIDVSNPRDAVVTLQDDTALLHLGRNRFAERLQSYVDLASALRAQVPDIEYVDLRFDSRVYVRPAGTTRRGRR